MLAWEEIDEVRKGLFVSHSERDEMINPFIQIYIYIYKPFRNIKARHYFSSRF